jgi:hypothetical protein
MDDQKIYAEIVGGPFCGTQIQMGKEGFKKEVVMPFNQKFHLYKLRENKNLQSSSYYDYVGQKTIQ